MGPNGATIKTPASDIYKLNAIKKIGNNIIQIPDKIIIKAPINMVIMNKINVNISNAYLNDIAVILKNADIYLLP